MPLEAEASATSLHHVTKGISAFTLVLFPCLLLRRHSCYYMLLLSYHCLLTSCKSYFSWGLALVSRTAAGGKNEVKLLVCKHRTGHSKPEVLQYVCVCEGVCAWHGNEQTYRRLNKYACDVRCGG